MSQVCSLTLMSRISFTGIAGIQSVGTIQITLSNADLNLFQTIWNGPSVTHNVYCMLRVIFGSDEGVLKFEITCRDKVVGQAIIDFHNHNQVQ